MLVHQQRTTNEVASFNGSMLSISRVNRLHMGAYLCIAQVISIER